MAGYRGRGWAVVASAPTIKPSEDPEVLTVEGDIADPATAGRIIGAALERFGRIDTLVNNAGVFLSKPFTDYTAADYATVVGVNLTGFFWLTQRAIAEMASPVRRPRGQRLGHPGRDRGLRHARGAGRADQGRPGGGHPVAGHRVRLPTASGSTPSRRASSRPRCTRRKATSELGGRLPPLGRAGQVSDVVDGVLFLESSPYITGEILHIDGGQIAGH